MCPTDFGDSNVRRLMKEALVEALREQREFLKDLLAEVVEDSALAAAIRQGRDGGFVDRDDVISELGDDG